MKIVADENMPYARDVFGGLGEVISVPGRQMTRKMVGDAEVLLVRSVTRVNRELLEGSEVRFVGTATIGTDHVDMKYLEAKGIAFANAAGCNANSVAEYVMTALLVLGGRLDIDWTDKVIGIVGVGHIGSRVAVMSEALEMKALRNDPPLQRKTGERKFVSLEKVLAESDIITCHVPLNRAGDDPTWHLIGERELSQLKQNAILINSSRGAVVDNQALKHYTKNKAAGPVILDVWENEPKIDIELLKNVALGTPHIAGYSFDGKVNGTMMLYHALCGFLQRTPEIKIEDLLPPPPEPVIELDCKGRTHQQLLLEAMSRIYDIEGDDARLRESLRMTAEQRAAYFDQLRKKYPVRREAGNSRVKLSVKNDGLLRKLKILGFQMHQE